MGQNIYKHQKTMIISLKNEKILKIRQRLNNRFKKLSIKKYFQNIPKIAGKIHKFYRKSRRFQILSKFIVYCAFVFYITKIPAYATEDPRKEWAKRVALKRLKVILEFLATNNGLIQLSNKKIAVHPREMSFYISHLIPQSDFIIPPTVEPSLIKPFMLTMVSGAPIVYGMLKFFDFFE